MSSLSNFSKKSRQFLLKAFSWGKNIWYRFGPQIIGSKFYDKWFFEACRVDEVKSMPLIARAILSKFNPSYVLDYGCGDGYLLYYLANLGIGGMGYEYSNYGISLAKQKGVRAIRIDFTKGRIPSRKTKVDIAVSLEVAEHLPEKYADRFCQILTNSNDAGVLIFSAAKPGQTGEGHLNEQPKGYWVKKLEKFGWVLDKSLTSKISTHLKKAGVSWYYWQNLQIFSRLK